MFLSHPSSTWTSQSKKKHISRHSLQVHHRQAPASTECCRWRRQRHTEVRRGLSHLLHDELHWLDVPQPVQYKLCATPPMSAAQCTKHHSTWRTDASTPQTLLVGSICVRRLPFRTATPTFNVRSLGLFCGRQGDLVLVTTDYARSVTPGSENFSFLVLLALDALRFMRYINLLLTLTNIAVPVCYKHRKTDWWSFYDRPRSPSTYRGATQNNDFVAATVADSVNVTVIGRA